VALTIAFVPGVTITKWSRLWEQRHGDLPLMFAPTPEAQQVSVLRDRSADVSFVRLPIVDAVDDELSVIRLYSEVVVVMLPEDHPLADEDSVTLADLATLTLHDNQGPLRDAVELVAAGVGALVVPHALARQHSRKDVVSRTVTDAEETWIAISWLAEETTQEIEDFVGIVRGRSANSSRGIAVPDKVDKVDKVDPDLRVELERAAQKAASQKNPVKKQPPKPRKFVPRTTARPQGKRKRQGR
jgi:DNA-binding transcriptional LysR family regulator